MKFWVIKHIPTGGFLPELWGQRGYTHTEPSTTARPRLFHKKGTAKNALTWWLRGKFYSSRGRDDFSGEYYEEVNCVPQVERIPEHMEVVEVEIKEVKEVRPVRLSGFTANLVIHDGIDPNFNWGSVRDALRRARLIDGEANVDSSIQQLA